MRAILFLLALFLATSAVEAGHCAGYSTSSPELDLTLAGAPYYVDNDFIQTDGPLFSLWVYEESNGISGLQRGDEMVDDTCHGMIEGDTIIF